MPPWIVDRASNAKLSPEDQALLPEAMKRRCDPDCPEDLRAVWDRWAVAHEQAIREVGFPVFISAVDWML